ncbi:MAG: tRNA (N(6)-L-threonylcarbamoyladenosine(37)-C(2))-methylthiotransferase MtaB [Firmicutes bacterium]|nr:tRNA (N(6)-L-threonylcarbamoyladenosine(37)-C(2))-methylthiotransferase MtaB [Bacillota bacterium]
MDKTFKIYSFGCKVNQEEGYGLAALFLDQGWQEVLSAEQAALYIVNACAVTQTAEKKARALIRRLRREYPQAVLVVTGCYAQVASNQIAKLNAADIISGLNERADLPNLVEQFLAHDQPQIKVSLISQKTPMTSLGHLHRQKRARAYLKIADGCGQFCHYCIIPLARGPVRSLPQEEAVAKARELIQAGHKEVVLSGIHIGAYGEDLATGQNLATLIESILALPGEFRLRLGSIEPQQFSTELLHLWASEQRICPHLHIPLQSGSDKVLASMNRHYSSAEYAALLAKLRAKRHGCAITSDIMVGYPGESAEEFLTTLSFCEQMAFTRLHVFPYSPRPGTFAANLTQQIPRNEKQRRAALLGELAKELAAAYARSFIGEELEYLYEQKIVMQGQPYYSGHSENYLPLLLPAFGPPPIGLCTVLVWEYRDGYLLVNKNDK